jgi:hypothetical protein
MKYLLSIALLLLYPPCAFSYVGPSLGTGTIGVILGIFLSIIIALIAMLYYPIKKLLTKLGIIRTRKTNQVDSND